MLDRAPIESVDRSAIARAADRASRAISRSGRREILADYSSNGDRQSYIARGGSEKRSARTKRSSGRARGAILSTTKRE